jgi:hypothetical protein
MVRLKQQVVVPAGDLKLGREVLVELLELWAVIVLEEPE